MSFVSYRRDCTRLSGAPCIVYVALAQVDLKIVGESITVFIDEPGQDERVRRHFCRSCGSPVFVRFDLMADLVCIAAATLDDPDWVRPTAQTGSGHRLPWAYPPTDLPALEAALASRD